MLYLPFATTTQTTFNTRNKRPFTIAATPKNTAIISSPIPLFNTNITKEMKAKINKKITRKPPRLLNYEKDNSS